MCVLFSFQWHIERKGVFLCLEIKFSDGLGGQLPTRLYEDRRIIVYQENISFGAIGKELGKDCTTIARGLKNILMTRKAGIMVIHIIRVD